MLYGIMTTGEKIRYLSERIGISLSELACKKAGVPHWHPNQLRHNAATRVRSMYGIEAARVVLGHSDVATSLIYAERDEAKARQVAEEIG